MQLPMELVEDSFSLSTIYFIPNYNFHSEIQQTNGILVLENFRLHGIGTQQQYITCYMLCVCLIVGFGISTVSTSMMIKSHNQIIQEFLYISWIKCHLNTSHNKATCSYPLRVTPTTSLGSDRYHFGTFVMKILFKICFSQLYQLNMIFGIITINSPSYSFGITSTCPLREFWTASSCLHNTNSNCYISPSENYMATTTVAMIMYNQLHSPLYRPAHR